jgi:hypothetical protein
MSLTESREPKKQPTADQHDQHQARREHKPRPRHQLPKLLTNELDLCPTAEHFQCSD